MIELSEDKWVDCIRAGKYPQCKISLGDIDDMVETYDPDGIEEAALNFDHEFGGPSHGWFRALRRKGDLLQALPRAVSQEMKEAVESGKWKRQSAEIYPEHPSTGKMYFRGLAALGNASPACKGLRPLQFANAEGVEYVGFSQDEETPGFICLTAEEWEKPTDDSTVTVPKGGDVKEQQDQNTTVPGGEDTANLRDEIAAKDAEIKRLKDEVWAANQETQGLADSVKSLQDFQASQQRLMRAQTIKGDLDLLCTTGKLMPRDRARVEAILNACDPSTVVKFGGKETTLYSAVIEWIKSMEPVRFGDQVRTPDLDQPETPDDIRLAAERNTEIAIREGKLGGKAVHEFFNDEFKRIAAGQL